MSYGTNHFVQEEYIDYVNVKLYKWKYMNKKCGSTKLISNMGVYPLIKLTRISTPTSPTNI